MAEHSAEDISEAAWRWAYGELQRIEQHWTSQLQNQQQRIATILTANGILLGLLGSAVFAPELVQTHPWPLYVLWAAFGLVAAALVAGALALWPRMPIRKGLWLDAERTLDLVGADTVEHALQRLAADVVANQRGAPPDLTLERRRSCMRIQLGLLMSGTVVLVIAMVCFSFIKT